jgi:hypothetical protein
MARNLKNTPYNGIITIKLEPHFRKPRELMHEESNRYYQPREYVHQVIYQCI